MFYIVAMLERCISNPAAADAGRQYLPGGRGVPSPAGKPGKPPGEAPNNHLRWSITFTGHFARNTNVSRPIGSIANSNTRNRISNILSIIYAPSWPASIRLGRVCRPTTDSTGAGRRAALPAAPPAVLPALSP